MRQLLYVVNVPQKPLLKAFANVNSYVVTTSRLNYKPDFLKMKSVCPIPAIPNKFHFNFDEVSMIRAHTLWGNLSENANLNLFWSGGIDSTVALVAILRTCPPNHTITVFCNLNSILENQSFYRKLLSLENVIIKNSSIMEDFNNLKIITGELGDQIFGSDLLYKIIETFSFEHLFISYEEIIPQFLDNRCGQYYGPILYDLYRPIVDEAPFRIVSAFDFIWWWNFSQKWQFVKFRKESLTNQSHKLIHFFEDEGYQIWSFFNHDSKINRSTVKSYKQPAKQFIFSYDKNEAYCKNKIKLGSPFGNKRYYYALFDDGSKVYSWDEYTQLFNSLSRLNLE